MNYFGTIKNALHDLIPGLMAHYNVDLETALKMVQTHLGNMSKEWFSGENPTIAYGDPLCRFAYLYCHTAANANMCETFIRNHAPTVAHIVSRLNDQEEIKVCAFGGGPGTELLALAKLLERLHGEETLNGHGDINFTLIDNVPEWAESWQALDESIRTDFKNEYGKRSQWPFTVSKSFQPIDMTKVERYANLVQLFEHDLYILNFVISEIMVERDALERLIRSMVGHAPQGARFVFIDRNQMDVSSYTLDLIGRLGLMTELNTTLQTNMDGDEQCSELNEFKPANGRSPRVTWNAFCLIGVKP
ncbi:MAG: hypothetical protein WBB32_06975 [Flavobacteriales bacterium]